MSGVVLDAGLMSWIIISAAGAFIGMLLSIIAFFLVRAFKKFDTFREEVKEELRSLNLSIRQAVDIASKIEGDMKGINERMKAAEADLHDVFPRIIELEKGVASIKAGGCQKLPYCGQ